MPDSARAKEKRRRRELEEKQRAKDAPATFLNHSEKSKELILPEGFHFMAGREEPFLQTDVAFYHNSATKDFAIKVNGRLFGPFKKHELQCLRDSLRNDLDI